MKKRSKAVLPEDLVVEILSRVPAKSVARLRSTSKEWNALIKDGRLAKKHSANAQRKSLSIMLRGSRVYLLSVDLSGIQDNKVTPSVKVTSQFNLKDPLSVSSEEVDISNVFHCNGLLLCTTTDNRLVVWNPVSGETKWIQPTDSYKNSDIFALGYHSKLSCYKILRIVPYGNRLVQNDCQFLRMRLIATSTFRSGHYAIYDVNSNSWSAVAATITDWFIPQMWSRGVSVKGNTYWLALDGDVNTTLISFDFSTERFQSHSLPHSLSFLLGALSVVRENQLCILNKSDVWMASKIESAEVMSWSKFITLAKDYHPLPYRMSFLADEQNKVVVCCQNISVTNNILHIAAEDRYLQVELRGAKSFFQFLLSYVPTLVPIQKDP